MLVASWLHVHPDIARYFSPSTYRSYLFFMACCPYTNFEPENANGEKGVPQCRRERRAFPNDSTRSSPRSVVSLLRPGLGADTENLYQTQLDQSPLRRAASEARDRLPQEPYPNSFCTSRRPSVRNSVNCVSHSVAQIFRRCIGCSHSKLSTTG